ncbi:MAG TPA: SpoIIE family protein phosphatase [Trebonia sp.]|jgi:serine phosphatase RsbU (regulator of sigma subunit)|nr:SpoIIE family protein phosphatase [Trebonia sp.]
MTRWNEGVFDPYLPAERVLRQAEIGVVVADRQGNILFVNEFTGRLLRLPGDVSRLAGRPLHTLGFIPEGDLPKADAMSHQVLRGASWEGTFTGTRGDGTLVFLRVLAVPLLHSPGDIDGIVLLVTEAGRRDAQREQDRLRLLERIGERLAGSLELDTTLRQVASILVPQFADHCFIDLFSGEKLIRRVQTHAGNWEPAPGTWAEVGSAIHYPPGHFMQQAMTRLETIVVPDLHAEYYPAPSVESMSAADQAGLTSVLASPLYARGELLGVMSLALSRLTDRADPHYDLADGDLIGAIASRVAVAIDNAMLFETERNTAIAFQESLLPQQVPELDGLDIAFRYVPAKPLVTQGQGIQTQVGGDWYDIIPLAAGRVGLVIGDVEGRGPRAAATMGQLRAALRAYAQDEKSPADIMRKLDEWVRSTAPVGTAGEPPTVSCIYMIYDAWSRELTLANAGHAAPLLARDGKAGPLEIAHKGVLLGVRGRGITGLPTYKEQTVELPPGAALVMYTDGLTDRRSRADGDGHYSETEVVGMLAEAIKRAAGLDGATAETGVASAVARAAETAVPGNIDDDMAILVLRSSPLDLASEERSFPAEPIMVSEARRLASCTFAAWKMDPGQAELACLLVSEVVTNAVLHASITPSPGRRFDVELDVPVAAGAPGALDGPGPGSGSAVAVASPMPGWENQVAHAGPVRRPREFVLRLRRGAESVWVEVFDPDLRLPRLRTAAATDEGGRGLYLVEQLATRWGSRPTPEGKTVWFEIPLADDDA